uniref:ubiquitinyl hydrolase 1 n=1 Tax=Heterorhabditis bacteriophora TaxID=37862 RepID=A0A1I7X9W4_HETBA
MVLYSIGVGELSDEIRVLDPSEPIYTEDRNTSIYACQVDYDPITSKLVIVKNQTQTGRSLSLPMVFTLRGPDHLNRGFLADTVLKFITDTFHTAPIDSVVEADDDSMNGEDRDPYKLFVMHGNTAIPFPSGRENSVAWPGGITVHTIVFQWRDQKLFNQYKGADLIDRECSVTTRKDIHLMECIDLFTKQEQLGEEDSWWVLSLHLSVIYLISKLPYCYSSIFREFELNSKLANERHEHVKYDLIAISHHMGGLGGGHYTASALNKTTGKWCIVFDFNDSCVSKTSAPSDPIIGRTPYLLVYRRKETVPDSNFEMETDE